MEKKTESAISRFGVLHPPNASASPPSSSTAGMGSNQASFAGAVRKFTEKFNAAPGPRPLAQATRNLAPAPSVPLATAVPAPGLPALPAFPTASADLKIIERAQAAAIFGPVSVTDLDSLVQREGNMGRALLAMARKFMREKLGMSEEEVLRTGVKQVCSTDRENILVKFGSIHQARSINQFKKNLPREAHALPLGSRSWMIMAVNSET